MADSKLTALTALTSPALEDLMYIVDDPSGTPAERKVTVEDLLQLINVDGWIPAGETWVYASADDPTFTFTIAGVDLTTKYYAGMRLKLTQTTPKYFIVTKVAFSTDTTITIYGGTDYDLANAAITLPYYSTAKAPAGFPLDPLKWTVTTTDTTLRVETNPSASTYYSPGSLLISVPIGSWLLSMKCYGSVYDASAGNRSMFVSLSTANNSASDADFTRWSDTPASVTYHRLAYYMQKHVIVASKTSYYPVIMTPDSGMDNIAFVNDNEKMIIQAVCAYL